MSAGAAAKRSATSSRYLPRTPRSTVDGSCRLIAWNHSGNTWWWSINWQRLGRDPLRVHPGPP